jgi:hypothetical protein
MGANDQREPGAGEPHVLAGARFPLPSTLSGLLRPRPELTITL